MKVTTVRAPGKPLEEFLAGDARIDVMKIDTEGAEPLIFRGAESVLRANRNIKIFMEFAPPMQQQFEPPCDFLARIRGLGFDIFEIAVNGRPERRSDEALLQRTITELFLTRG